MKERKKSLIFLSKVGQEETEPELYMQAHLLMSILYKNLGEEDLKDKHFAYASRMKLRQEGKLEPKMTLKELKPNAETSETPRILPKLDEKEIDDLYFTLIDSLLIPEGITTLAREAVEQISDTESSQVIKLQSKIMFGERKFEEVVSKIEDYLEDHNKFDVEAIKLMANSYFLLQKYEDSEKAFLRAIRRGANDPVLKKRLGLIYIRTKKWREASTVFNDYCNNIDSK